MEELPIFGPEGLAEVAAERLRRITDVGELHPGIGQSWRDAGARGSGLPPYAGAIEPPHAREEWDAFFLAAALAP